MKKFLTVSAVAAIIGLAGLWIKNKNKVKKVLPRQTVLIMLKQIDRQSFMIVCQMAACVDQIVKSSSQPPSPSEIKQIIEDPQSQFPKMFQQLYATLYHQHNTTEEEFEDSIEHAYADDPEIQFYRKRLAEDFHKAMLGVTPCIDRSHPLELSQEKVLRIIQQILKQQLRIFQQGLKLIKQPATVSSFKSVSEVYLAKFKTSLYQKEGLSKMKDSPETLLELAISQYSKQDGKFGTTLKQTTETYQQKMNSLIEAHSELFV